MSNLGEAGEAEPVENSHRGQATDGDLMDGEAEGDTVVIAGQPEVLSTQAMQVCQSSKYGLLPAPGDKSLNSIELSFSHCVICCMVSVCRCRWRTSW